MVASKLGLAAALAPKKLLFYCRSAGFEHSVVKTNNGAAPSYAERIMVELGAKYGFDVTCTKDGRIFDKDYEAFDGFFFYTTEDLTKDGGDKEPPMSAQGKKNFLDAIHAGKGRWKPLRLDTFHSPGDRTKASAEIDPYIQMIGGEFIRHGRQQNATMTVTDPKFPGVDKAGAKFDLHEEWYSLKNFALDMHVILVQETKGMQGRRLRTTTLSSDLGSKTWRRPRLLYFRWDIAKMFGPIPSSNRF